MGEKLDVGQAVGDAYRLLGSRMLNLSAPLLLLWSGMWALQSAAKEILPERISTPLLFALCCLVPLVEYVMVVLASSMAIALNPSISVSSSLRSVLGYPGLRSLVLRLYWRLVLWCLVAVLVVGTCSVIGYIVWMLAGGVPHHAGDTRSGGNFIWLIVASWSVLLDVLLSRYAFALPMMAISGGAPTDLIEASVAQAKRFTFAIVGIVLVEGLVVSVPIAAMDHYLRPHLASTRFAYQGLSLIASVIAAIVVTYFVLLKLALTEQIYQPPAAA